MKRASLAREVPVVVLTIALLAFASLLPVRSLRADDNLPVALDYLNRMGNALHSLNYQGTLVYLHGDQIETMQLIHKSDDTGEHERLIHLSGAAREVIRDGDMVICYLSDIRSVVVGSRRFNSNFLTRLQTDFKRFVDNYNFTVDGEDRIAGRSAHIIQVIPRDEFRYGYKIWIDQETYLMLKSDLVDKQMQVLEQVMFTNVDVVDDIPAELLKPAINSDTFTWHRGKDKGQGVSTIDKGWKIGNMPTGFILTGHFKQQMPGSESAAEHMVISDGLASISVYIESFAAESQGFVGTSNLGAINLHGSVVDDYKITVVGEVPETTVRMIAASISHQSGASDD